MQFGINFVRRAALAALVLISLGAQVTLTPPVSPHQSSKPSTVAKPHAASTAPKSVKAASAKPATAAPAQPLSPVSDTRAVGSWVVHCYRTPGSVCDISQVATDRRRNLRVSTISIAYLPPSNVFKGAFVVPLGVSFAKGMTIRIGAFRLANLKYRRCERDGCYVEGVLPQNLIDAMTGPDSAKGSLDIEAVNGVKLSLPIGLDGFRDGVALMKELDAQKPATPPPPATP